MDKRQKIIAASITLAVLLGGTLFLGGSKTPPKIPTGSTYQGFIKDKQGLIEFTDKDVKSFNDTCKDEVKVAAGVHTYYSLSDDTVEEWFKKIKPEKGNKVLLAYYSAGETIDKEDIKEGWHLYPKGPYGGKDVFEINKNDIDEFTIPAKRALHIISMKETVLCSGKNLRTSADHISKFETDDLKEIKEGWILVPTTLPYKDSIEELEKDFDIKSAWTAYKGSKKDQEQYKEVDVDKLKLPSNSLPMSWFYVENKDKKVEKKKDSKKDPKKDAKKTDTKKSDKLLGFHDFPTLELNAKKGDFAMIPFVKDDYKADDGVTYIGAEVVKVDDEISTFNIDGEEVKVNNSLVLPLTKNAVAAKGDLILAAVTEEELYKGIVSKPGKSPAAYLFGDGSDKAVNITKDTFIVVKGIFAPGASVAFQDGKYYRNGLIINQSKDKALIYDLSNNSLNVIAKKDLIVASPKTDVRPGKILMAPIDGVYTKVTVKTVDRTKGTVSVEYTESKKTKKETLHLGEFITLSAFN